MTTYFYFIPAGIIMSKSEPSPSVADSLYANESSHFKDIQEINNSTWNTTELLEGDSEDQTTLESGKKVKEAK